MILQSKFKALHAQAKTKTAEGEIEPDDLGEDDKIKQISLFQTQSSDKDRSEKKKAHTNLITGQKKKDLVNIFKNQHQNDMEGVQSDAEKNTSLIYKEKEQSINNHPYRHLIFSPLVTESTFKRHLTLTYRGLVYAKKCLKGPSDKFIKSKQIVVNDGKREFCEKKKFFLVFGVKFLFLKPPRKKRSASISTRRSSTLASLRRIRNMWCSCQLKTGERSR